MSETKELIELIDDFMNGEPYYYVDASGVHEKLTEIKETLELHSSDGEWQQPNSTYKGQWIPNVAKDRLVEKILDSMDRACYAEDGYCRDTVELELRKILQDRK